MAEACVTFLLNKIDYLITREWDLLRGIDGELESLKRELEAIKALLRDADTKRSSSVVRVWIQQVRDSAYDIEDVFDNHAFQMARKFTSSLYNFVPEVVIEWKSHHLIAPLIEDVKTKPRSVQETKERYRDITLSTHASSTTSQPHPLTRNPTDLYPTSASLYIDEADIVGIEKPREALISWAVQGESKLKVMFVVGMRGSGKTTLVKKAYEQMRMDFDCYAWITVPKSGMKREVLQTMLGELFGSIQASTLPLELNTSNEVRLMDQLQAFLQHRRYIIVLDNLCSKDVWESIRYAFPNQNKGRIIITTPRGDIASLSCDKNNVTVHDLQPLPLEKAQELFYKKACPSTHDCPPGLKAWGEIFLKICEGLPLGIVAIGNLLSSKKQTADAWKTLHGSLGSELTCDGHLSIIMRVLSISYDDLPSRLKYCFFYLSNFPEDHSVKRRKLIRLWISEGLVEEVTGKTLEQVGEDYLQELIDRNLVKVNEEDFDGRARSVRVHGLLLRIILSKSQEENFCAVSTDPENRLNGKIRRLSIHKSSAYMPVDEFPSVRTFFMFGIEKLSRSASRRVLSSFKILKVLDLEAAPLDTFPPAITKLLLLRYLSLRNTGIRKLPTSLGNLKNLETLDLKQTFVADVPNEVLELNKLRHLMVYHYNIMTYVTIDSVHGFKASAKIGGLEALQKLSFIKASQKKGMIKQLGNLKQLRKLGIIELEEEDGKHLCYSIQSMKELRSLDVASIREEVFLDLNAEFTPPQHLGRLYLKGRLREVPDWIPKLRDLVRIRLKWSKLESNPINALQDLPNLMELQLLDAFTGNQLVFSPERFPKLKILELEKLESLQMITMEESALPCLEKLIIRRCQQLKLVPKRMGKLAHLKEFYLHDMPEEFVEGLQKNKGKYRHLTSPIPLIHSYSHHGSGQCRHIDLS